MLRDVVNFRDGALDSTAGFEFAEDDAKARLMDAVFDQFTTLMQLAKFYYALDRKLERGVDLATVDPQAVIREEGLETPEPMSPELLSHGPDILDKLPAYLEGTAYPHMPDGIALEDGAGQGLFVDGFSRHFKHLVVLDISMVFLLLARKIAQERGRTNVTLVCGSAERLPFADEAFDFIQSNNVIEHISDQPAMIAEAYRTLAPTGLFFVRSPNRFSLYREPHFHIPAFGFIPKRIREKIIWKTQNRDQANVALRSLGELRKLIDAKFKCAVYSFIPATLRKTSLGGGWRKAVVTGLSLPGVGKAVDLVINKFALGLMPYHTVICWKQPPSHRSV